MPPIALRMAKGRLTSFLRSEADLQQPSKETTGGKEGTRWCRRHLSGRLLFWKRTKVPDSETVRLLQCTENSAGVQCISHVRRGLLAFLPIDRRERHICETSSRLQGASAYPNIVRRSRHTQRVGMSGLWISRSLGFRAERDSGKRNWKAEPPMTGIVGSGTHSNPPERAAGWQ